MGYPIERKLVVGVSSSALFDLEPEDNLFRHQGIEAYRTFQNKHKHTVLPKGAAFPFIKRFLSINDHYPEEEPIEVVLLSKNGPETGVRVFNSIQDYGLNISRAAFTSGKSPFPFIPAYNISLFLSNNATDVKQAMAAGYAAGRVLKSNFSDEDEDTELRVAFDFDGVVADDGSEKVFKEQTLDAFQEYEAIHRQEPHKPGPLADFFKKLAFFQKLESKKRNNNPNYKNILRTSIVTARSAPAHERAITTLRSWGVEVDELFLMGGVEKSRVLNILKPHIYFDDQMLHLDAKDNKIPLVHIPFGVANE